MSVDGRQKKQPNPLLIAVQLSKKWMLLVHKNCANSQCWFTKPDLMQMHSFYNRLHQNNCSCKQSDKKTCNGNLKAIYRLTMVQPVLYITPS